MSFKPHRDNRPMSERPVEIQMEAKFFQSIQPLLTKKQQGRIMGAFRETISIYEVRQKDGSCQTEKDVE